MTRTIRLHPLDSVSGMGRYLFLLLIPLIRGLTLIGEGWRLWFAGAWIDLCVLLAILGLGILRWRTSRIETDNGRLVYVRGLFFRSREIYLPGALTCLTVYRPLYLRAFRAAIVRPEVMTSAERVFYPIIVRYSDLRLLEQWGISPNGERVRCVLRPGRTAVAWSAASASSVAGGLVFAAALLSDTARFAGEATADGFLHSAAAFVRRYSFGLPTVIVIPAAVLAASWLLAFVRNLARYSGFSVLRSRQSLTVRGGLLNRYRLCLRVSAVEWTELRFRMFTSRMGVVNVAVHAAGFNSRKFLPAVIPGSRLPTAVRQYKRLLPEMGSLRCAVKARPRDGLGRALTMPATVAACLILASVICGWQFQTMRRLITFWCAMACLVIVWIGMRRVTALFHTGFGVYTDHVCAKYLRGHFFRRVSIPADKLLSVTMSQTVFQRRTGVCDVVFRSAGRHAAVHRVRSVPREAAERELAKAGF